MSRQALLNVALSIVVVVLVGAVIYLEQQEAAAPAPTTTTTTSTTVPPTTTTSTTTTSTTTSTTSTTSTTTTSTLPPTTLPPPPRGFIDVVVVNGSTAGERLEPTIGLLRAVGYNILRGLVGAVQTPDTKVYYLDETFVGAAEVLALDVGLTLDDVAPLEEAPPISGLATAQLVLYLGGS